jgi:hypothetical protein
VLPGGGGAAKTGIEPARSVSTDVAGLSSGDLALVLVGMGAIAATGILMARLARGEERKGQRS